MTNIHILDGHVPKVHDYIYPYVGYLWMVKSQLFNIYDTIFVSYYGLWMVKSQLYLSDQQNHHIFQEIHSRAAKISPGRAEGVLVGLCEARRGPRFFCQNCWPCFFGLRNAKKNAKQSKWILEVSLFGLGGIFRLLRYYWIFGWYVVGERGDGTVGKLNQMNHTQNFRKIRKMSDQPRSWWLHMTSRASILELLPWSFSRMSTTLW